MLLPKTPFSKANHFGISISSSLLNAILVDVDGGIATKASVGFESPIIDGDNVDSDTLTAGLRKLRQEGNINLKFAAICIPEKHAYSREHVFPKLSDKEITEALFWQIEKIFPFSASEIYFDWKILEKLPDKTRILVTAIPKQLLDNLKNSFLAAGIFPISFESSASAISRLISNEHHDDLIIAEVSKQDACATLIRRGISSLTSTTNISNPDNFQTNIETIIINILTHYKQKVVDQKEKLIIYITGSHASKELANNLSRKLGNDVLMLEIDGVSISEHLAFSVSREEIADPDNTKTINLLPTSLQQYYKSDIFQWIFQGSTKNI